MPSTVCTTPTRTLNSTSVVAHTTWINSTLRRTTCSSRKMKPGNALRKLVRCAPEPVVGAPQTLLFTVKLFRL